MQINQIFKNLGFSENETKIYLAALETGLTSAQNIADKAELKRTTVYSVLDALIKKNIIFRLDISCLIY